MTSFQKRIYEIVRNIAKGKVKTYKEVAEKAGRPKAWRAVGNILNKNTDFKIPCHRVVRSDGQVGGYRKGSEQKLLLLKKEGVKLKGRKKAL